MAAHVSPFARVIRTIIQVGTALVVAIPVAAAAANIPATTAAKGAGFVGGAVVIISAVWNAVEAKSGNAVGG